MRWMIWRLVVKAVGGFHERGRWAVVIHDRGVYTAKDRIVRWEWKL